MKVKDLIVKLLDENMNEDVFVSYGGELRKIRAIISTESDTNPRYYVEIVTEPLTR